jgi:hypothetical protein
MKAAFTKRVRPDRPHPNPLPLAGEGTLNLPLPQAGEGIDQLDAEGFAASAAVFFVGVVELEAFVQAFACEV